jgi:hypothetical protein
MKIAFALTFLIASALVVSAQPRSAPVPLPPVESVVVTGTKSPQALHEYVEAVAVPTRLAGKLARWEVPVCPVVVGLKPEAVRFITRRLREVAAGARAPVSRDPKCHPNIQIVFTTAPQTLIGSMRRKQSDLLGYYDTIAQLDRMATVHLPIQAWYMTATHDVRGTLHIDSARTEGMVLAGGVFPNARPFATTASRLGDGLRASLHHVTIVADPTKLLDYEMGPMADYIAVLALSRVASPDRCQSLPTITNLLTADCPRIPGGLSDIDLGYLRGLYHMNPEYSRKIQTHEVVYQVQQELIKAETR